MLYKDVVNNLLGLLLTYPQIKMAEYGELLNFFEHNKKFTFAMLQPVSSALYTGPNKNTNQHTFTLFVGDQLNKGHTNTLNIFSSNLEIINKFLFDLKTFSADLILMTDNIEIQYDFYSQDEEVAITFVNFSLITTSSTAPAC